ANPRALTCRAVAISIPRAWNRAASVLFTSQRVRAFALQAFLNYQPRRKAHQIRAQIALDSMAARQCLQALACPLGCGYPVHRGAPSSEAGRQTEPRRFAKSGDGASQPFFQQS